MDRLAALGSAAFASRRRLAVVLGLYLGLHAAARLWLLPQGLGYDDAEQVLSAQAWAWAYRFEQPPLVTWLLLLARDGLGLEPGLGAITLLRTLLLGALCVFTFLAARHWLDVLAAGGAAAGLLGTYTLGWLAHGDLPHSTLLAVAVAATLWLWGCVVREPTFLRTFAFGLACGLGLLAKWNFIMFAVGLLVAALLQPATRPLALSWRTPFVGLVMASLALPSALAVLAEADDLGARAAGVVAGAAEQSGPAVVGWLEGWSDLALAALAFPQPFLVLAMFVLWPALRRPAPATAWLALLMAVILMLHAAVVPLAGAREFPERWMIAALLPLPILVLAASRPGDPRVAALGGVLVLLMVIVWMVRVGIGVTDASYCGKCRYRLPAPAFAAALGDAGFREGTIVAFDMHLAGNLKQQLPDARVLVPGMPLRAWPAPGGEACALVWRGDGPPPAIDGIGAVLGVDWTGAPTGRVAAPILGTTDRFQTMSYRVVPGAGACR